LKLLIAPIPNLVLVSNRNALVAKGLVQDLEVKVQAHSLTLLVYLLPVAGADLVLGATWLSTLGPHISDYNALTVKFQLEDHFVTLYGEKPKLPSPAQFHHLSRMHHTSPIYEVFTLHVQHHDCPADQWFGIPTDIAVLLRTYKVVFDIPSDFPPPSSHNHTVSLLPESGPVKVRPYRYLHNKKQ